MQQGWIGVLAVAVQVLLTVLIIAVLAVANSDDRKSSKGKS